MTELELHPLLGERSRLLIMAALASATQPMEFMTLLASVGLTRGNLTVHLRKLEDAGLVSVKKAFVDRKPCTTYRCTEEGRTAVKEYLRSVEELLKKV